MAMEPKLERAKDLVPSVILTVLSMIQALALEFFWAQASTMEILWQGGWQSAIAWFQLIAVIAGILLIWVGHVNFVLRFRWLPTLPEMVMPFFIGIIEFGMIEIMHPDRLGPWLLLLSLVFAASIFSAFLTMRAARREPCNDYFFDEAEPITWRTYRESGIALVLMIVLGLAIWNTGSAILSFIAMLIAFAALVYQFIQIRKYWMHLLSPR